MSGLGETADGEWAVYVCERNAHGWELCGITQGTQHVWGDTYWFELRLGPAVRLNFWGNQVLIRSDKPC